MGELFALYRANGGARGEIALIEALAVTTDADVLNQATAEIELRTMDLFVTHKDDCLELLHRLLTTDLSSLGERIVRIMFAHVTVTDALELSASKPQLLPTMVQENPALASSPELWSRAPIDRRKILAALVNSSLKTPELMREIVDAVIRARAQDVAEDLLHVAGEPAVDAVMMALRSGDMELDWQWKNALTRQSEAVVSWIENAEHLSITDLTLITKLVSPLDNALRGRCAAIWSAYLERNVDQKHDAVVASFGLALGFGLPEQRGLVLGFFQPVFDALEANSLEYEAWNWLRDYAPSLSWWRDWDKCERLSAAIAKRLVEGRVTTNNFLRAVRSEAALKHVVGALYGKREGRAYLDSVRGAVMHDPTLGTASQRRVLQERRW